MELINDFCFSHTPSPNGKSELIGEASKPLLDGGDEGCSSPEKSPEKRCLNSMPEENFDDCFMTKLNDGDLSRDFASASPPPPPPGQTVLPNQIVTTAQIHMVDAN